MKACELTRVCMQLVPSLALHDTMKHVESQVATVAFGSAMGMAGFLLAVGQKVRNPNTAGL